MEDYNTSLELFIGTKEYTVETAPVGLLLLENGTIICKSEYKFSNENPKSECIIVSSGEYFHGADQRCISIQIN